MADGRKRWSGIERQLRATHGPMLAGVDEVGRGPLAGPVVACAVIMPADRRAIAGVDDSKRVAEPDRVRLARKIRDAAVAIGVGAASVREIDTYNIYHASTPRHPARGGAPSAAPGPRRPRRQPDPDVRHRAHRRRARGRALLRDRLRVDHRQGAARQPHAPPGAPLSGLRLGAELRLCHVGAHRGAGLDRQHAAPPHELPQQAARAALRRGTGARLLVEIELPQVPTPMAAVSA